MYLRRTEIISMSLEIYTNEYFMKEALKEAEKALQRDEVPIGAVIVTENTIIARAHNLTESLYDVTAHAEVQAITAASNYLGAKYLTDCKIYVTLEPCVMCAAALGWSQISHIIYGATDEKRGFTNFNGNVIHPKTIVKGKIMENECKSILLNFFKSKR